MQLQLLLLIYMMFIISISHSSQPYPKNQGCDYSGKRYDSGSWIDGNEPCVQCKCIKGAVVCRRKSCQLLPDPPPPGCVMLKKNNHCCPQLHCKSYGSNKNDIFDRRSRLEAKRNHGKFRHHGEGCLLNGTLYGEGSALMPTARCEYCYCMKGKQQCIRPQCLLSVPGCTPIYSHHSCCPVKYNCSSLHNLTSVSSTTALPVSTSTKYSGEGCKVDGVYFPEGERVEEFAGKCENCFCVKNTVRCEPVTCGEALDPTCSPVHVTGHCCPSRFNCSGLNEVDQTNIIADDTAETTTIQWPTVTSEAGKLSDDDITTTPTFSFWDYDESTEELPPVYESSTVMNDDHFDDTEERNGLESNDEEGDSTTEVRLDETTTYAPSRTLSPELEAILNRTRNRQDTTDYDYDESSLPPSLPNLKIIPFVAADALVDMDGHLQYFDVPKEALGRNDEHASYFSRNRGPLPSRFSPPAETQGGFMPRDPVLDGPYYETKHVVKKDQSEIYITTSTATPQVIERCIQGGRVYQHGEVVSELNACELCVCYFGYIQCQEPKCSPVVGGCYRIRDVPGSCCGRIQCGSNVTENTLPVNRESTTTISPIDMEIMTNLPIITVADDIVTPDILKDMAIRTEPAPDLTNMANFLTYPPMDPNSTTSAPMINITNDNSTEYQDVKNETANLNKTVEGPSLNKEESNSNDYGEFSFDSVLDMLFGSGPTTSKAYTKVLTTTSSTPVTNKTTVKSDVRQASSDSNVQQPEIIKGEYPTKAPVFNGYDYDADIIKNTDEWTDQIAVPSEQKVSTISTPIRANKVTKSPIVVNKMDPIAAFGLLKIDGCNIYGKMYRIGKIITELSEPCLECRCTHIGVECKPQDC